jgi:hypothetical protein
VLNTVKVIRKGFDDLTGSLLGYRYFTIAVGDRIGGCGRVVGEFATRRGSFFFNKVRKPGSLPSVFVIVSWEVIDHAELRGERMGSLAVEELDLSQVDKFVVV